MARCLKDALREDGQRCVACGGTKLHPWHSNLLKCPDCGHCRFGSEVSEEQLRTLYNEDYFTGGEYENHLAEAACFQKNFRLRMKALRQLLDPTRHQTLLEIGCGYGIFLDLVRHDFKFAIGIDIAESAIRYARERFGLNAICGEFLEMDFKGQTFDVVCLWDTLEHLPDPARYVEKIECVTRPGALLAITTGDIESLNARLRGSRWRMIHPPSHLHYFSRKSLSRLLERHGFKVVHVQYCGYYRSLRRMVHNIVLLRWKRPTLYAALSKLGIPDFGLYLNLYDILYVIACKR